MEKRQEGLRAAFTGHQDYDGRADALLRGTVAELWRRGYRRFASGMASGFDLSAAEAVLGLRSELPGLELEAVVPFAGQERGFASEDRMRHRAVFAAADVRTVLCDGYRHGCYFRRNDYLVEHADCLVAWYVRPASGTGYTVRRALRKGIEVINLYEDPANPRLF